MIAYYQMSIACFLGDIDPISKICKISFDESSGLFGARRFQKIKDFQHLDIYKNNISKLFWDSSIILCILGSPKINIIGFGAQGHVKKSRNHRNEGV